MSDGKAQFDLVGDPTGFQRACRQALASLTALKGGAAGVSTAFTSITSSLTGFGAAIAGVLALGGITSLVSSTFEAADALGEMAQRVGMGVEPLQELQHVAKMSGASVEDLETGLKFLNRSIGDARAGNTQAVKTFSDLGVSVYDANGRVRDTSAVLDDIADKFKATLDPAERTRLAMAAFGRSGTSLIPMLAQGSEGIRQLRQDAHELGVVLDADLIAQAGKTQDALDRLAFVVKANLSQVILSLGPDIEALSTWLMRSAVVWRDWGHAAVAALEAVRLKSKAPATLMEEAVVELKQELAALEAEIARHSGVAAPLMAGSLKARVLDPLNARANEIRAQIAGFEQTLNRAALKRADVQSKAPQMSGIGGAGGGASAEQLEAVAKLGAKFIASVAPDDATKQIGQFRAEVENLAQTLDPKMAAAVRAMGDAFVAHKTSMLEAGKAMTAFSDAAQLSIFAGNKANLFSGLQETEEIAASVEKLRAGIVKAAEAGTPASQLFQTIGEGTVGLAAQLEALKAKYAEQPAILERIIQLQRQYGEGGVALRAELDASVRAMNNMSQGEAKVTTESGAVIQQIDGIRSSISKMIDATTGIETVIVPRLQNTGIAVLDLSDTLSQDIPSATAAAGQSLVTLTGNLVNLYQTAAQARAEIAALAAEMAASKRASIGPQMYGGQQPEMGPIVR